MLRVKVSVYLSLLCILMFSLSACSSVKEMVGEIFPTPSPLPTQTPLPRIGQVDERMEWGGWAITVSNVLRSSLNPRARVPGDYRPDDRDYISMDVTVERMSEERGFVHGEDFVLVDGSGTVYEEDPVDRNWTHLGGEWYGTLTSMIVIPVDESAQDLILRFTPSPELPEPLEIALDRVKEPRRIDLLEAIELGLLSADVRGMSLEKIEIELEVSVEVEDSFELSIAPGTMFLAPSPDLQTMVVRREMVLFLTPKQELSVDLKVACANMTLKAPEGGETYIVKVEPPKEELRKLLGLPEFKDSSFRLQQFAIWVVTDNPPPGGFVGLGSGSGGSSPSRDELNIIRGWFEKAGIAVENYAGFR
jgi:hypothetical protein